MLRLSLALLALSAVGAPLLRTQRAASTLEFEVLRAAGPPETTVDVLFVGDGYTAKQLKGKYLKDAERYTKRLLEEQPFKGYAKRFAVRAAMVASEHEGCDRSPSEERRATALQSHFDSPDGRLLVFKDEDALRAIVLAAGPPDIVFVMVNTETYGGAGTVLSMPERSRALPAPTFSAQDTRSFLIALHELGHSFGGLADEYADEALHETFALPTDGGDLDEANVTLARGLDRDKRDELGQRIKWKHFLALPGADKHDWLFEGGYYREKGVVRPWRNCKMRENEAAFCPVCDEEMTKAILACLGEAFDDAAYHKARPLSQWR